MPDELRFDRKLLEEAIDWAGPEGEGKHRLVYHFLCMLRQMGWNWRKEYLVVLYDHESEPDFDEEYANYLEMVKDKIGNLESLIKDSTISNRLFNRFLFVSGRFNHCFNILPPLAVIVLSRISIRVP